jgi:hypothetical protein
VVSPDPRFGQVQTCLWNLVRGLPLASLLVELIAGWGVGLAPNPTSCSRWTRAELLWHGTEGTLVPRY